MQQANDSSSESQQLQAQVQQQLQVSQAEAEAQLALLNASNVNEADLKEAVTAANAKLVDAESRSDSLLSQLTESCLRCSEAESHLVDSESHCCSSQEECNRLELHLATAQNRVSELEEEVSQIRIALQGVQGELSQSQAACLQSYGQAEEARQQLAASEEKVQSLTRSLSDAQARCTDLQSQADALSQDLSTATDRLAVSQAECLQSNAEAEEAQHQLAAVRTQAEEDRNKPTAAQSQAEEAKVQPTAIQTDASDARTHLSAAQGQAQEARAELAAMQAEAEEERPECEMSHSRAESYTQGSNRVVPSHAELMPQGTALQVNPLFRQQDIASPAHSASATDSVLMASPVMAESLHSVQTSNASQSQQADDNQGPNPSLADLAELPHSPRPTLEQQLQQQVGALHSQLKTQSSELQTSEAATEYVQRLLNAVSAENRDLRKQLDKKQILKRSASELQHASACLAGSAKAKGALAEPSARVSAGLQPATSQIAAMWVTTPNVRRSLMPEYGQSEPYMGPGQALEGAVSLVSRESAEPVLAESALVKSNGLQHHSSNKADTSAGQCQEVSKGSVMQWGCRVSL